nr:MAG TPA: hypothetical protein [Bacteriophage sp.]
MNGPLLFFPCLVPISGHFLCFNADSYKSSIPICNPSAIISATSKSNATSPSSEPYECYLHRRFLKSKGKNIKIQIKVRTFS